MMFVMSVVLVLAHILGCFAGPDYALPPPSIRHLPQAPGGGYAHRLLQAQEAGDQTDRLRC